MSADSKDVEINGHHYQLHLGWLRITHNPVAPGYPKSGDFIKLRGHWLLDDGIYLVIHVSEYEPAVTPDSAGRDIRLDLIGKDGAGNRYNGADPLKSLNGWNIVGAIIK